MLQSKFSSFTYCSLFITPSITIGVGLLLYDNITGYYFNYYPITKQSEVGSHRIVLLILLVFVFLLCVFSTIVVYKTLQKVFINSTEKTIAFKKILSKRMRNISFNEVTGYYDSIQHSQTGFYKVLLLNSNGYIIGTISSIKYSNYDQMEKEIEMLKYLGRIRYSLTDKMKMLQNKRLIKVSA